ncbi:hypothetical protein [Blastococcus saxobsidens]|uniref:DUF998 domain-containing protein n=1 Tax=Blastococcus saxobsidens (strain DD2) TaxID=1146883 RepID=H6RKB4_BLASD|nr:hypothetical protein [Blastococcus saxobsidens]CCG01137.1 conserved protein of unknown function [Blastococcus saxobsidens DD2]
MSRGSVGASIGRGLDTRRDRNRAAVTTWRYLRLALVGLALGLACAVLYERSAVDDCWQTSISAYYYTPVQSFFVGALVTIGVCLISLRGASDGEDVLLNLAGICAPFVALVPTPDTGDCGSVLTDTANRAVTIDNNVTALLFVAWIALGAAAALGFTGTREEPPQQPSPVDLIGFGIALVALGLTTWAFLDQEAWFAANAHDVAAICLFFFVFLNVCLNAVQRHLVREKAGLPTFWLNRYTLVALVMLGDAILHYVLWRNGWPYWVLTIEFSLIGLFALFWSLQTAERWADGVSPEPALGTPPRRGGERDATLPSDPAPVGGSGTTAGRT